jgi:hypothetical protein
VDHAGIDRPCGVDGGPDLVGREVVQDQDVAGPQLRGELLSDVLGEEGPFRAPSMTNGASTPPRRKAATKVVVFQWPWGVG